MLDLIQDVELFKSNGVYLVEGVEAGDVLSVAFDDVDDVVFGGIAFD